MNQIEGNSIGQMQELENLVERESTGLEFCLGRWVVVAGVEQNNESFSIDNLNMDNGRWIGCIMHVGSNYVDVKEPHTGAQSWRTRRVHFGDVWKILMPLEN
ncbi:MULTISPECIES: hypothetical protein [Methylomonas]|uniref:Uncharacterized protein n=1 Tax=Methylomonas defluvii TaxID=3045149 RepID=A0ABU4UBL2_9GAMM|nr:MULTISPECIES: hypothetical protein [Methylomonas]MDX8126813.1 hypothetical protein [Methylomonas sp. OY6]